MATISIPIETKVRELDGKLWLARVLAQEGHTVALGEKSKKCVLNEIRPDIYIGLSLTYTKTRCEYLHDLKKSGAKIGVIDTEGGVFLSKESYLENNISKEILDLVDVVFAWGKEPANIIRNQTPYPDRQVHVTGNPRFDLLQQELRAIYSPPAKQIKKQIGNYVIFNTNFTTANPYDREKLNEILEKRSIDQDEAKLQHQTKLIDEFLNAVQTLSDTLNNHIIVIRPHPSENHNFYRDEFADNSSVLVEHSGDVRAWIYGADCVIHNGCTTGIESALLNTPVISFEPDFDIKSYPRAHLPNKVSRSVTTHDELVEQINSFVAQSEPYELTRSQKTELKKYFENVDTLSASKIASVISDMDDLESTKSYPDLSVKRHIELWVKKQSVAPHIQRLRGENMKSSGYREQKFPGLSIDEVRSRLNDFNTQIGKMNLKISRVNYIDDIYWIKNT